MKIFYWLNLGNAFLLFLIGMFVVSQGAWHGLILAICNIYGTYYSFTRLFKVERRA